MSEKKSTIKSRTRSSNTLTVKRGKMRSISSCGYAPTKWVFPRLQTGYHGKRLTRAKLFAGLWICRKGGGTSKIILIMPQDSLNSLKDLKNSLSGKTCRTLYGSMLRRVNAVAAYLTDAPNNSGETQKHSRVAQKCISGGNLTTYVNTLHIFIIPIKGLSIA